MRFFHVYNEESFRGLEKNNMINRDTGFKIQNVFSVPEDRKFNNIAAVGGRLHSMIKNEKYPFYVDRIAGGITYQKYDYDKDLIREYENILGDWFLGFQLHESASNRRLADWKTLISKMGSKGPYDVAELDRLLKRESAVTPTGEILHSFSQGSIEEYSKLKYAETIEEFIEEFRTLVKWRMDETLGHILPCDSFYQMTKLYDDLGIKTFMPEVGAQIPMMRKEVALARGVAKSSRKTWGLYYECWLGVPGVGHSMPCFNTELKNEWYLTQETHTDDFTSFGKNGGSSRLLQDRVYNYALMSGADYFSEEWGLNCSYTDMETFELSEYGLLKRDFIHFAEKMRGVRAKVPFAIVFPKETQCMQVLDYRFGGERKDEFIGSFDKFKCVIKEEIYRHLDTEAPERADLIRCEAILSLLFKREDGVYGNEGHTITNSAFGDVFDIIYEDADEAVFEKYDYLIDATLGARFSKKCEGKGLKILDSENLAELEVKLQELIEEVMPCYVSEKLTWLVSEDEGGRRFLSLFNNEGNMRSRELGDTVDNAADKTFAVSFKEAPNLSVIKTGKFGCEIVKQDDLTYTVKLPATSYAIIEF